MAVAVASTTEGTFSATSTPTITAPTGVAVGDLLIAWHGIPNPAVTFTRSGWTALASSPSSDSGADTESRCIWKIADSGDAAAGDFQFTLGSSATGIILLIRVTGAADTAPITNDAANSEDSATSTHTTSAITPDENDSLLLAYVNCDNSVTGEQWTVDTGAGWAQEADYSETTTNTCCLASKVLATPASTSHAFTFTGSDFSAMFILAIKPAVSVTLVEIKPADDITTTGWTSTPLWSKVDEDSDSPDATVISATSA